MPGTVFSIEKERSVDFSLGQHIKLLMHGSRHFTNLTLERNNDVNQNGCIQDMKHDI